MTIVPAIIPTSAEHLEEMLVPLRGVAKEVQVDLVDATFGDTPSWPFQGEAVGPFSEVFRRLSKEFLCEVDLMVGDSERLVPELVSSGVARLVVHPVDGVWPNLSAYKGEVALGVAFHNGMSPDSLEKIVDQIDFVQCMGISEVGVQGNAFDDRVLAHIRFFRKEYPHLPISVDGHVTMFTLPLLKEAGAVRFVSGSAIFSASDPVDAFNKLSLIADV
jgi:ribulose-phosphate 3-epimerase